MGRIYVLLFVGIGCVACWGGGDPLVKRVEPNRGPVDAEQSVRILGDNFRTDVGYTVYFGSVKSPAVTILNDKTIMAEVPAEQTPQAVDVTLYSDDGVAFRIKQGYRFDVPEKGSSVTAQPKTRY